MTSILNSLMSGGYEPDVDCDLATDFDLWLEEHEAELEELTQLDIQPCAEQANELEIDELLC